MLERQEIQKSRRPASYANEIESRVRSNRIVNAQIAASVERIVRQCQWDPYEIGYDETLYDAVEEADKVVAGKWRIVDDINA